MATPAAMIELPTIPKDKLQFMDGCLGRGGMGTVVKALHLDWHEYVAVKYLHVQSESSCDEHSCDELKKEAQHMYKAIHEYIMSARGLIVTPNAADQKYVGIVLPYMKHGSLDSLLANVDKSTLNLTPNDLWPLQCQWLYQIAAGMNFLHSQDPKILHLDLKPGNLLISDHLDVKISDFGLSRLHQAGDKTIHGVAGTIKYKPPEYLKDLTKKPNTKFDIYSFGITIWSILARDKPFKAYGLDKDKIARDVFDGTRPKLECLTQKRPTGSKAEKQAEDVVKLMTSCWDPSPGKRPEFNEFIDMLKRFRDSWKIEVRAVKDKIISALDKEDDSQPGVTTSDGVSNVRSQLNQMQVDSNRGEKMDVDGGDSYEVRTQRTASASRIYDRLQDEEEYYEDETPPPPIQYNYVNIKGSTNITVGNIYNMNMPNATINVAPPAVVIPNPGGMLGPELTYKLSRMIHRQKGDGFILFKKLGLGREHMRAVFCKTDTLSTTMRKMFGQWEQLRGRFATRQAFVDAAHALQRHDLIAEFVHPSTQMPSENIDTEDSARDM